MNKKNYLATCIVIVLLIILLLLIQVSYYNTEYIKWIMVYSIGTIIISIIRNKKNNIKTIFGIFLILYYIPLIQKFYFGYKIEPFDYTISGNWGLKTMYIYSIFGIVYSIIMIITSIKNNTNVNVVKNIKIYNNPIIFYSILLGILVLIFMSHSGGFVLNGGYGTSGSRNILNEYLLILFPIAYIYSGKNKYRINSIYILAMIYTIINILYADRIGILILAIELFLIFLNNKIDYKKIIFMSIVVGFIFTIIGQVRIYGVINNKIDDKIIQSNTGNVFIASNQIVRLKDEVESNFVIKSFFEYAIRIIVPQEYLSELSDPGTYVCTHYKESLGGGFIASYFYFWFGIIGTIVISIIVALLFSNLKEYKQNYKIIFIICLIAFFPRWIAYQPIQFIKVPFIGVGIYGVFSILNNILEEK